MRRARVDVARSRLTSSPLLERTVELPRVSPRVETKRHRFAYYAAHSGDATNQPFDAVMKHDLESGRLETYAPGADAFPGEAIFVPKRDRAGCRSGSTPPGRDEASDARRSLC